MDKLLTSMKEYIVSISIKIFKMEVIAWLESAFLRLIFANTVFHKRAMLQIF